MNRFIGSVCGVLTVGMILACGGSSSPQANKTGIDFEAKSDAGNRALVPEDTPKTEPGAAPVPVAEEKDAPAPRRENAPSDAKVIGSWVEDKFHDRLLILFQREGTMYLKIRYPRENSSGDAKELTEKQVPGGRRFDEKAPFSPAGARETGEHLLLTSSGELQRRDNEGLLWVCKRSTKPVNAADLVDKPRPNPPGRFKSVNPIYHVAFSADGSLIASAPGIGDTIDKAVTLWDVRTGMERTILKGHTSMVDALAFSPVGSLLASGGMDESVRVWDVKTGEEKAVLKGHTNRVLAVAFSPDGSMVASVAGKEGTVKLWDVKSGKEKASIQVTDKTPHPEANTEGVLSVRVVESVGFSPDGTLVATGSRDVFRKNGDEKTEGTITLWDVATGKEKAVFKERGDVNFMAFGRDGQSLIWSIFDTVKVWDLKTGKEKAVIKGSAFGPRGFSPDGLLMALSSGKDVKVYDLKTRETKAVLRGHSDYVQSVAFSPDGTLIASGSNDKTIKLWDVRTGKELSQQEMLRRK